jgi:hypothetical protein
MRFSFNRRSGRRLYMSPEDKFPPYVHWSAPADEVRPIQDCARLLAVA